MKIFKVGDLVSGTFPDNGDLYPNGQARYKTMYGIITGVFLEEGYETYRLSVLIRNEIVWSFNYSLHLVEVT